MMKNMKVIQQIAWYYKLSLSFFCAINEDYQQSSSDDNIDTEKSHIDNKNRSMLVMGKHIGTSTIKTVFNNQQIIYNLSIVTE